MRGVYLLNTKSGVNPGDSHFKTKAELDRKGFTSGKRIPDLINLQNEVESKTDK